jgi:hypothetical protein
MFHENAAAGNCGDPLGFGNPQQVLVPIQDGERLGNLGFLPGWTHPTQNPARPQNRILIRWNSIQEDAAGFDAIQPLFSRESRITSGQVIDHSQTGGISPQTLSVFEAIVQYSHENSPVPMPSKNTLSIIQLVILQSTVGDPIII